MKKTNNSWTAPSNEREPKKSKHRNFFKYFSLFEIKQLWNVFKKNKPLTVKILFTIMIILIFRIGASITIPGVFVSKQNFGGGGSFIEVLDLLGGGALRNFSVLALGISPFITASIVMQLLQSEAFPPIYRLAKSGPRGKRKINVITRIVTLFFAITQAIVIISQFSSQSFNVISIRAGYDSTFFKFFVMPAILIGGALFSLFLGEQITNRGVGNGTSLLIFSGIAVNLPTQFRSAWQDFIGRTSGTSVFIGVMNFFVYFAFFLFVLYIVTYFYKAERHIPIQQTGAGMTMDVKRMSRLPIKVNPAGVMPVIFPLMLLTLPQQIAQFFPADNAGRVWIMKHLVFSAPLGMGLLIFFVFLFSIGMSLVTFNPIQIAENFKKQGTFIPGVRPGRETENYLTGVVTRLSIFSGFYLSAVTVIKYVQEIIGLNPTYTFGGTSVLILVSVAIETINQLKARNSSHKISLAKKNPHSQVEGLLW